MQKRLQKNRSLEQGVCLSAVKNVILICYYKLHYMKTLCVCLVIVLTTTLFCRPAAAQDMSIATSEIVNNQILQTNLQIQINQQIQNNLDIQRNIMMLMLDDSNNINLKYNYLVTMKDNAQLVVHSKIYADTARHKTYLLFVDKKYSRRDTNRNRKIYVSQTLSIARKMGNGSSDKDWDKGMATDSCWMFKAISGNINAYTAFSEDGLGLTPPPLMAIQKGDGPIIKLTASNLKPMVEQDAGALKNIQKKNYYRAIEKYNHDAEKSAKK